MDPILLAAVGKLAESGLGWCVCIVLGWLLWREIKDRRACEKAATELMMQRDDKHHALVMQMSNSQTEVLATNARMIEGHTASQNALLTELRDLAAEIKRRPLLEGR